MNRYSSLRLAFSLIAIIIYLFLMHPMFAIICSVLIVGGYVLISKVREKSLIDEGKIMRREAALRAAKIYLNPYQDIWKNLRLSNKYCSIRLGRDGHSITVKEHLKDSSNSRTFRIIESRIHSFEDLWNMFCINFDNNKTYDGLLDDCRKYKVTVLEDKIINSYKPKTLVNKIENSKKIDINNCSEVELTALPGISIVMSKKIIKKREEIGGFKNTNDFFLFLKLKPHMQKQLENLICVNKMKGLIKIEKNKERSVDL